MTQKEQQQKIDSFFALMEAQIKEFLEANNLIPHGQRYDFKVVAKRYRDGINLFTEKSMNSQPRWEESDELPTPKEWGVILKMDCFDQRKYGESSVNASLREFILRVKEGNEQKGAYTRFDHYGSVINNALEDAGSQFRLFKGKKRGGNHALRKVK